MAEISTGKATSDRILQNRDMPGKVKRQRNFDAAVSAVR